MRRRETVRVDGGGRCSRVSGPLGLFNESLGIPTASSTANYSGYTDSERGM